jgi:hypothetical protein
MKENKGTDSHFISGLGDLNQFLEIKQKKTKARHIFLRLVIKDATRGSSGQEDDLSFFHSANNLSNLF